MPAGGLSRQDTAESRRSLEAATVRLPPLIETSSQPDKSDPDSYRPSPPAVDTRRASSHVSTPTEAVARPSKVGLAIRRSKTFRQQRHAKRISFEEGRRLQDSEEERDPLRPRVSSLVLQGRDSVVLGPGAVGAGVGPRGGRATSVTSVETANSAPPRLRRSGGAQKLAKMRMRTLR